MSLEDKAQELELKLWEQNNATRQVAKTYAPTEAGYGTEFCIECDDPLPDVRRAMGSCLCTPCKAAQEATRAVVARRRY